MQQDKSAYLKEELATLLREDPRIFDFVENAALDGMWYWDVERPEYEWLSPGFKALFGYEDHEMENTPEWWQANIHPDDLQVALDNFEAHVADPNHPYDQIVRYSHRDGHTVWVRCRGLGVRDENGQVVRMLGAHTDVTALKQREEELRQANAKLQAADKAKDVFLSNMAHEIRTPLAGVVSSLELIKKERSLEALDQYASVASQCAATLQSIIDNVLDLSKLQSGSIKIASKPLNVGHLLTNIASAMSLAIEEKGLQLKLDFGGLENLWVMGDEPRISQVLFNLLNNARKYTDTGHVALSARAEAANDGGQKTLLHLEVSDTGRGLSRDQHKFIFKRFEQVDGLPGTKSEGVGLGLAIVKELLDLMSAHITVESEIGKGSTFKVVLEMDLAHAPKTTETTSIKVSESINTNRKVLLAEDHPINRGLFLKCIGQLGLECSTAVDGEEAVKLCREKAFDMIFMDVNMPKMNGLEATKTIRTLSSHYTSVPIIAVTADAFIEDIERCKRAGMNDHVAKPFTIEDLEKAILRNQV